MDNKYVGTLLLTAIAVIVGLVMLVAAAQSTSILLNKETVVNESLSAAQWVAGNTITLTGKVVSGVTVINTTAGGVVPASNYTISNNVILSDGTLGATLLVNAGTYNASAKNISYTYEPLGYADQTSRSIIPLIILFGALAIAVVAMVPAIKNSLTDMIGK